MSPHVQFLKLKHLLFQFEGHALGPIPALVVSSVKGAENGHDSLSVDSDVQEDFDPSKQFSDDHEKPTQQKVSFSARLQTLIYRYSLSGATIACALLPRQLVLYHSANV